MDITIIREWSNYSDHSKDLKFESEPKTIEQAKMTLANEILSMKKSFRANWADGFSTVTIVVKQAGRTGVVSFSLYDERMLCAAYLPAPGNAPNYSFCVEVDLYNVLESLTGFHAKQFEFTEKGVF